MCVHTLGAGSAVALVGRRSHHARGDGEAVAVGEEALGDADGVDGNVVGAGVAGEGEGEVVLGWGCEGVLDVCE